VNFETKCLSCKARLAVIILFVFVSQQVVGQQSNIPAGLNFKTYETISPKDLPEMDTATFFAKLKQQSSGRIISETVAYNFKTNFTPNNEGIWKNSVPGIDSWFIKLRSKNAFGLALVFTDVALLPGETLYVYNQHGLRGPYTNGNIPRSGILPLNFLQGDEVVIEYDVPTGTQHRQAFTVETVSHAFQNIFKNVYNSKAAPAARTEDMCYLCIDDEAIEKERRSVVKLSIVYDSITKFCSGVLVNNTAQDQKAYILTAQHCVTNQFDADRTTVVFGFEDIDCVGSTHYDDFVLSGAYHRASLFENDFSLLEFYNKPPLEFHPYYAGWDISDKFLDGVTSIHHPQGGPKKISISNGEVKTGTFDDGYTRDQNAFWNVEQWDVGVTEGGSSGAPLFNKNSNVMGTLSGGSSICGSPYNDYFEKLSASWEVSSDPTQQLKYWLDPIDSNAKTLDGNDPFEGVQATCNTVSNVKAGEQQHLLPYTNGFGYFSGFNSDSIASYAEKFSAVDSAMLTGVTLNVGSVNTQSSGGLLVSVHSNSNGLPGPSLADSYIPYYRFKEDSTNDVEFYPYVKLTGDFFISYTMSYSPADSFALMQVDWRSTSTNTAFAKLSTGWVPMNTISPNGLGSSFGIKITLCENNPLPPQDETPISFYPNPVTTVLIGRLPESASGEVSLQVYDIQGRLQTINYNTFENNVVITTSDLSPGMYIVKLSTVNAVYQSKFVKL